MMFPRDHLVAALHQRGICYLAPSPQGNEPHLTDAELLIGLASSKDGRLRFALAGLLLVHPQVSERVACLLEERCSPTPVKEPPAWAWAELRKQYLAAMYLQRMWRTRLRQHFGDSELIPERFTIENDLPSPDVLFGEAGLRALTERSPYNDWSSYEQVVEMICEQPCDVLPLPMGEGWGEG
jgi:hypothetical protein